MKRILPLLFLLIAVFGAVLPLYAQNDKAKRVSPPVSVSQTVDGLKIDLDYSQPSVKGRTIGKDLEPLPGKVWRTGANEATVISISGDALINGQKLSAGKYALFSINDGNKWTFIFNKTAKQWGAFNYKESEDALRINVEGEKPEAFSEKLVMNIDSGGNFTLLWGDKKASFTIKPAK
jgi:hypothetical protein